MSENTPGPAGAGAGAGAGGLLQVSAHRQGERLHVLSVRGEVDLLTAPALREAAESYVSGLTDTAAARGAGAGDPPHALVVDLRRVGFIDSEGLTLLTRLRGRGGDVFRLALLVERGTQPERVLKLGGYDRLLRVLYALDELPPGDAGPPP